jgi:uncharacterized iron-regulated protein
VRATLRLTILCCLVLPLLGCATSRLEGPTFRPSPGVFFTGDTVHSLDEIPHMLCTSDFILIGESHTNPCDHRVQELLLQVLAGSGKQFVIGLEMVDGTGQDVLDRFNRGELGPEELENALDWPRSWGHPFALYKPLFEGAARWSIPVHGLNLPSAVVRTVGRTGLEGLSPEEHQWIPEPILLPAPEQVERLRAQYELHRFMFKEEEEDGLGFDRFLLAQSLRDTFMAERAVELFRRTGAAVLVIAGSGHVEHGWGIALRISTLTPDAGICSIQPWRGGAQPDPGEADLFFHCPELHQSRLGFDLQVVRGAVLVASVKPGSRAEAAGIEQGDRILRAGEVRVRTMFDLHKGGVSAGKAGIPLVLVVRRGGERLEITIERGE